VFADVVLRLSPAEEVRFRRLMERPENKEVKAMRKTWSEELMEKGEKRGEKRGEMRGEKRGEMRGEKRGEKRAKRETLLRLLRAKFGAVPKEAEKRVQAIEKAARLDELLDRILTARSLAEMNL